MSQSPSRVHNCSYYDCKIKTLHNTRQTNQPSNYKNREVVHRTLPDAHYTYSAAYCPDQRCSHSPRRYKYVNSKVRGNLKSQKRARSRINTELDR